MSSNVLKCPHEDIEDIWAFGPQNVLECPRTLWFEDIEDMEAMPPAIRWKVIRA
jgi:hypothetical protein